MIDLFRLNPVFALVFCLILGIICFKIGQEIMICVKNSKALQEEIQARIISKRTHVSGNEVTRTSYYITFELQDGQRLEVPVKGEVFGILAEGDRGSLVHKGTRFIDFKRQ